VTCNSNEETGQVLGPPGVDVLQDSPGALNADYVTWDNWYQPSGTNEMTTDIFTCDASFNCSCIVLDSSSLPACKNTGRDDYSLVQGANYTGSYSAKNGAQTGTCP